MLYDPKWEQTTKDPMSLESLIAWLERRPADEEYTYGNCRKCVLAQYFTAMGYAGVYMMESYFYHGGTCAHSGTRVQLPKGFNGIAVGLGFTHEQSHTFGKALARAQRL